jgi:hypothetical protein
MKRLLISIIFVFLIGLVPFVHLSADDELETASIYDEDGNYVGRVFDETYDALYDDFDRDFENLDGTGLWWESIDGSDAYFTDYHLVANYSATLGHALDTPIYKVGSSTNALGAYTNLVIEMTGLNGASINDLEIAFRLDDDHTDIYVPFEQLLSPELQAMPEFDGTKQVFVINLLNSLDGKSYENYDSGTLVAADNKIQGLHFMSEDDISNTGTLLLEKVYWTTSDAPSYSAESSDYQLLDDFRREDVNKSSDDTWWRGSVFSIVGAHLALESTSEGGTVTVVDDCTADNIALSATDECVDIENRVTIDDYERSVVNDTVASGYWWYDTNLTTITDGAVEYNVTGGAYQYLTGASPTNNFSSQLPYLLIRMKGTEGLTLESLRLRSKATTDDPYSEYSFFNQSMILDQDGNPIQALTTDYQWYVIDLAASGLTVNFQTLNFNLGGWGPDGTLYIDEIAIADKIDAPTHDEATSTVTPAVYRSAGYDAGNSVSLYDNFVLKVKADALSDDLLIAPYYIVDEVETYGDPVLLSSLKGPDGELVPNLSTSFQNIVISFSENGWDADVLGFKFMTPNEQVSTVYIDQIFFTDLEYDPTLYDTEYPILDSDIKVFDHFDRDEVGATLEYDPANATAIAADLDFIIAYAGLERMSIEDDDLVFDTTVNDAYMQYTVGAANRSNDGTYEYVVFKVKGSDEALLSNFRIATIDLGGSRSEVIWTSSMMSGNGLNAVSTFNAEGYPYLTEDGYTYVIVDLVASGLPADVSGFDLFYSGGGKFYIDAIFFANEGNPTLDTESNVVFDDFDRTSVNDATEADKWWIDTNASIDSGALLLDATDSANSYYRTAGPSNNNEAGLAYMLITMKGSENTTLESFRMVTIDGDGDSNVKFFNAGDLIGIDGNPIPALTTEYQTYVIDLEASDLYLSHLGYGLYLGDWASGQIWVSSVAYADSLDTIPMVEESIGNYTYPLPLSCDDGYELVDGVCVVEEDDTPIECDTDQTLVDGVCIDNVDDDPDPVTCEADQSLVNGQCVDNVIDVTCAEGEELVDGACVVDNNGLSTGGLVAIIVGALAVVGGGLFLFVFKPKA